MLKPISIMQIAILSLFFLSVSTSLAEVDWNIEKTIQTGDAPLDVATTSDGKMTFVLTKGGSVLIYNQDGSLKDKIPVGNKSDSIEVSPKGDRLFLSNEKNKTVQIISLSFTVKIDTAGAPFKGNKNAPVTIAVFSDFQ